MYSTLGVLYIFCFISHKLPFNAEIYHTSFKRCNIFFMKIAPEVKYPCKNSVALNLGFRILFSHLKVKGEVTPMKTD